MRLALGNSSDLAGGERTLRQRLGTGALLMLLATGLLLMASPQRAAALTDVDDILQILDTDNNGQTRAFFESDTGANWQQRNDGGTMIFRSFGALGSGIDRLTLREQGTLGFGAGTSPLIFNSLTCCTTGSRMTWAHSPTFPNWGTFYDDVLEQLHYQTFTGNEFATFDFASHQVGFGNDSTEPERTVHVREPGATLRVEDINATTANRTLLDLFNNGGAFARFRDSATNTNWVFGSSANTDFLLNANAGSPVDLRLTTAGNMTIPGTLSQGSDVKSKEKINDVDSAQVLETLADLDVSTWEYKADRKDARHIGPMAQDFRDAFGFGHNDRFVAPADMAGVALAAIQELTAENQELRERIEALEAE